MSKITLQIEELKKFYKIDNNLSEITAVSSISNPKSNSLIFCKLFKKSYIKQISKIENILLLVNQKAIIPKEIQKKNVVLFLKNPRMEYVYILNNFLLKEKIKYPKHSFFIDESASVDPSCVIEPYVFISKNVKIGKNCHIKSGVKILQNVEIGENSTIGANTVIGDIGFGIERINKREWERIPLDGDPMKMPHLGGVNIGKNVEIGSLNTIVSGAIDPTIIEDYVKTDDHVHIAHNCKIRRGVLITAAAELSGGVEIGEDSWIGPNCSIFQQKKIGKKCVVGLGANIFKDMKDGEIYIASPAKKLMDKKQIKK
jgi:UDP-3-O-[3-hydroxymyristoyl] glucosamine N-acyltransferase LpxD